MLLKATDYLTQTSLLRLIAVLTLVISVHTIRIPAWENLFLVAALAWRVLAARRQWALPPPALRAVIVLLLFAGVWASFGRINGQYPGTALLVAMAVMKLLEMRSRRDVMVTVFLMYFLLLTHFLFSQEIWTIGYLFVCTIAITAMLIEVNHPSAPLPPSVTLRAAARMVAWSVPLMLLLFVLFPRIPGPLWGLPADTGAETGLADEMAPGDIARLIQSQEVALRVRFLDAPPPMRERYWRGPVFDTFDGRTWFANPLSWTNLKPPAELRGPPVRYETTLEAHRGHWLFALDLPDARSLPRGSFLTSEYQLALPTTVRDRMLFAVTSYPQYQLQPDLSPLFRRINTQLPQGFNARARELAGEWASRYAEPGQIAAAALRMYREQPFIYTLRPSVLGRNSIDEFLFKTRRGFCEHYAGSFTFLMRAAGVPARIVGGYMGGQQNEFGDYYVVRQSDAHAWVEIWIDGRGWVRVDPTAAVSPDRIEQGLSEAIGQSEGLPDFLVRSGGAWFNVAARWDWINNQWNRWVLAYGPDLQEEFLRRFGLADWSRMILALTLLGTAMLMVIGAVTLHQFAPARNEDIALRWWRRAGRRLLRQGIAQRPAEGPQDFVARLLVEFPEVAGPMQRVLGAYLRLRYLDEPAPALQAELEAAVRELPASGR